MVVTALASLSVSSPPSQHSQQPQRSSMAATQEERPGVPPLARTTSSARRRSKLATAEEYLSLLRQRGGIDVDAPGFADGLRQHFESLPSRCCLLPLGHPTTSFMTRKLGFLTFPLSQSSGMHWMSTLILWMCSITSGCLIARALTPAPSASKCGRLMWARLMWRAGPPLAAWTHFSSSKRYALVADGAPYTFLPSSPSWH